MVGIVLVSHSAKLADGAAELAREMGGPDVRMEVAGGLDLPERPIGTDAVLVMRAVERVWSEDGVLVLMDLGSAVLSAEMALEMLDDERRPRVLLCEAPFVEGAIAAAVAAKLGRPLDEVAEEARGGLAPKVAHLAPAGAGVEPPTGELPTTAISAPTASIRIRVDNRLGLHARPAARLVATAAAFDADVRVRDLTNGRGPAPARSLNGVATLGVLQGHEIELTASGPQAQQALDAVRALADDNFGDEPEAEPLPVASAAAPPRAEGGALTGLAASPGVAVGPVRTLVAPEIEVPAGPAGDPQEELAAFERALGEAAAETKTMRADVATRAGEQAAAIFDAHLLFLQDEELVAPVRDAIARREGAAAAWDETIRDAAATWRGLDTEYLRARAADLEAVGRQVLAHLAGVAQRGPIASGEGVLVARDLTPAETASLDPASVRGIATAAGGPTSHAAVLARSLAIPAVVGLGDAVLSLAEGTTVVLDGAAGTIVPDPDASEIARATATAAAFRASEAEAQAAASEPASTDDGTRVEVFANVGRPEDASAGVRAGAEGIGLLRTEFLFLGRDRMPDEREQADAYAGVAAAIGDRPVILRTLDVGGDKPLPYVPMPVEANPFLGVRGLRLGLARPELLRTQLRAVLRAAAEHPMHVMFPMVSTLDELLQARALLDEERRTLADEGVAPRSRMEVGIMVEVPSAALSAAAFAPHVDFFSIGTNDLTQYTLAAERGNERVASLADGLHPAVLRLIRSTVEGASAHGCTVAVCGELGSDVAAVPILVGLGVRELSVAPPAVPRVKRAVRATRLADAEALAEEALGLTSAAEVRALLAPRR